MADKRFKLKNVAIRQVEGVPFYSDSPIEGPSDAVRILANELSQYDKETVMVVNMNATGIPINVSLCSVGSVNEALFVPKDILKSVILSNASSVILVHNHPSHSLRPSKEDIVCTDRIQQVCTMLGVSVVDHVIIGDKDHYYSFKEQGIMPVARPRYATSIDEIHLKKVADHKESIHEKLERNQSKTQRSGSEKPKRKEGKERC